MQEVDFFLSLQAHIVRKKNHIYLTCQAWQLLYTVYCSQCILTAIGCVVLITLNLSCADMGMELQSSGKLSSS